MPDPKLCLVSSHKLVVQRKQERCQGLHHGMMINIAALATLFWHVFPGV